MREDIFKERWREHLYSIRQDKVPKKADLAMILLNTPFILSSIGIQRFTHQ
jgi:hypothetical protein